VGLLVFLGAGGLMASAYFSASYVFWGGAGRVHKKSSKKYGAFVAPMASVLTNNRLCLQPGWKSRFVAQCFFGRFLRRTAAGTLLGHGLLG
jgi:hypothetical protein